MTRLHLISEFVLAACIFVSWYFIYVAAAVIAESQSLPTQPQLDNKPFYDITTTPYWVANPIVVNPYPQQPIGYGYSIITTERQRPDFIMQYLGERNYRTREVTTTIVPNNAWGQPIRPINPYWP